MPVKLFVPNFISSLAAIALAMQAQAQTLPGWNLVWSDEFTQADNSAPDSSKWGYDIGGSGWGNNELQYYTSRTENARIEGGQLVIEARAEGYGGRNYTSARLLTKNKAAWTYGRIEARIKIPRGQGIWPAFWMLGSDIDAVGWPGCGEIDIMENIGALPSNLYGTIHGPGYSGVGGLSGSYILPGAALADDFHVYAIEREENRIRWFIDGQQYFTLTPNDLPAGTGWVFNTPQFLILNVAVGGNWPGNPDGSTVFPQRMTVDYVRVYTAGPGGTPGSNVTVDPAETWLGFMHVSDLPANGGAYQFGQTWATADLKGYFSGSTLTLAPNSINDADPYWYVGGGAPGHPGNKIMDASMYVEKTGSLSGQTVVFTGTVTSNTFTNAHSAVAYIRDFAPDYSSVTTVTTPLVNGTFSISLQTASGAGRHVQYGFQTIGVNVWSTDAAPFGTVEVTAAVPDPFDAWLSGFDFTVIPSADLTAAGDPDGDGENNLMEFALDGDPTTGRASGKVRVRIEPVEGDLALVLTLPALDGAVFSGSPAKSATVGNVAYTVEGSNGLSVFNQGVTEFPASPDGMPALHDGWSYRSFRLDGAIGGASPRGPAGYLRARISIAP